VSGERLQAVVIGAGSAGKGHTLALQHSDVHVRAICARDAVTVEAVARQLGVPEASVDWQQALETVRPDIVSIATPASLRREVVEVAAGLGCHILCEKPLAVDGSRGRELCDLVERAGVKHAYAATQRYDPSVAWLAELVRSGAIGELREIDITFRGGFLPPLAPWTWFDTLATGGGCLSTGVTHWLGMLERVIGGPVLRVTGEARVLRHRAPFVPGIHDFRQVWTHTPSPEGAAGLTWRECDADDATTMLAEFGSPDPSGTRVLVTAVMSTAVEAAWPANGWRLFGDQGTLIAEGTFSFEIRRYRQPEADLEPMPVPQRLKDVLPTIAAELPDESLRDLAIRWAALVRDLVADIQGAPHEPYLDFYDGWRYQEAIDAIRSGEGWRELPTPSR
jgi:predicted dehydrogenase